VEVGSRQSLVQLAEVVNRFQGVRQIVKAVICRRISEFSEP
jgi:hypothetical protein